LKRILVYSTVAVVLGLALTLVPLITLAEIRGENHFVMRHSFPQQLERLEGTYGLDAPKRSVSDVRILAFSFVIALVAYGLFKRRTPHHDHRWGRPFLY